VARREQAVFDDLGENGKLGLYDQLNDVRRMAEIEDRTFAMVKQVIFGRDADPRPNLPEPGSYEAGVLLEVMKDLLYQAYVRRGRLQQAMMVRRYFAEESGSKVTPLDKAGS
jgi:hypothetical protein